MKFAFLTPGRRLLSVGLLVALSACGGGAGGGGDSAQSAGALAFAERAAANDRSQILAVASDLDAKAVLDWIEYTLPTLFAKGPASFDLASGGTTFTIRAYPHALGTRYVGITTEGTIYGLGDFSGGQPQAYGTIADVAALVRRDRCAVNPGSCNPATVGLPPDLLEQPAHADCASLRSGRYRFINPNATASGERVIELAQLDAPTATLTWPDGVQVRGVSTGGCTFHFPSDYLRMVVSKSGMAVFTYSSRPQDLGLMFPEQQARLSDLEGRWNWLSFGEVSAPVRALAQQTSEATADGRFTTIANCPGLGACTAISGPLPAATLNAEGGFDLPRGATQTPLRVFSFRPANGQPVLVAVNSSVVQFGARIGTLLLPTLGDNFRRMDLMMDAQSAANDAFTFSTYSASAVDAAGSGYTRQRAEDGVLQRFDYNRPRAGVIYRAAGTSPNRSGGTTAFSEIHVLPLMGTGIFVYGRPTTETTRSLGYLGFSIEVDVAAIGGNGPTGQRPR